MPLCLLFTFKKNKVNFAPGLWLSLYQCAPCRGESVSATHNKQAKVRADFSNINEELAYKSITSGRKKKNLWSFHRPHKCLSSLQVFVKIQFNHMFIQTRPGGLLRVFVSAPGYHSFLLVRVKAPAPFPSGRFSTARIHSGPIANSPNVDSIQSEKKGTVELSSFALSSLALSSQLPRRMRGRRRMRVTRWRATASKEAPV